MYEAVREFYMKHGFGQRVGFGERPAIVVIDLAKSWLDTDSVIGSDLSKVVENTAKVLSMGREKNVPIFFTTMAYDSEFQEAVGPMSKKLPHIVKGSYLERGSEWIEIDPSLKRRPNEIFIYKQRASAFWGTPFLSYLIARNVDTLLITGCSTSGCIRSTAESAHNENFHTIVVKEAVGDRSALAHECNLTDIDLRFADVTPMEEVIAYLRSR